jgi:hypothetical protein
MNDLSLPVWTRLERRGHFRKMIRVSAMLLALVAGWTPAHSAVLLEDATLIASKSSAGSRGFAIAQAGRYELQLTDVGLPARFASLQAAITRGDQRIAVLAGPGSVQFDAVVGQYEVQVAGVASDAAGFGSFATRVVAVPGGTIALDYSDAVSTPLPEPPAGQTVGQTQVAIADSAAYRITLADHAFPEDLASVDLLLTRGGVEVARLSKTAPAADFAATPGTYDLLIVAQAGAASSAGLFGVRIANLATGARAYDSSVPVGRLGPPGPADLPATASYSLTVADLQFPVALTSAAAAVVRGSEFLGKQTGSGTVAFSASAGIVEVFALPTPAVPSEVGAMSVELTQGSNRVASLVVPLSPPTSSSGSSVYEAPFTLPAAGNYRATLTDFNFPASLGDLQLAVYQGVQELGRRSGVGTLDVLAAGGAATLLIAATPGAAGSGLFGIEVAASPGGTVAFEATQAAGANFERRQIDIATTGSYDVRVSDLQFPVAFQELAAAVTRGTQRIGFVFGGGTFSFDATQGTYFLNLVTRVNPAAQFGTYGLAIETTPPPPTLTLTANPTEVTSGNSSSLTWTSTGATSCVASGQWSGSRAVSGSQSVGPLTVESTFTLTCSGPGGSTARSAIVTVQAPKGGGGGGALDLGALLLLLLGVAALGRHALTPVRSGSA